MRVPQTESACSKNESTLQLLLFAAVLCLTHLLHPVHDLAVERFLNGDVHESRRDEVEVERATGRGLFHAKREVGAAWAVRLLFNAEAVTIAYVIAVPAVGLPACPPYC